MLPEGSISLLVSAMIFWIWHQKLMQQKQKSTSGMTSNWKVSLQQKKQEPNEQATYTIGKIFANDISDKELISKIYKQLRSKTNNYVNEQRNCIVIFPKKTYKWPRGLQKDVQYHSLSGKCKLKSWWDNTSHLLKWLLQKKTRSKKCWRGCEERERLYTVGGNVNWYSYYGK